MVDVQTVDLADVRRADADACRRRTNLAGDPLPLGGIELLRVVHAQDFDAGREHDRRGDYRSGQRTDADLVNSGDVPQAGVPKYALEVEHGLDAYALVALALVATSQRLIELAYAGARVALQAAENRRRRLRATVRETLLDLVNRELGQV